jgi:hypothetical protein
MGWLIQPDLAATGQLERGFNSPRFFLNFRASYVFGLQQSDLRMHVFAQEIKDSPEQVMSSMQQLAATAWVCDGMQRAFRRGQGKYQPALASIYGAKSKNVAKECPIRFRILAVEQHVSA